MLDGIAEVMSSLVSEEEMDAGKGEKSAVLTRIRQRLRMLQELRMMLEMQSRK
jgi:hypothetical protein